MRLLVTNVSCSPQLLYAVSITFFYVIGTPKHTNQTTRKDPATVKLIGIFLMGDQIYKILQIQILLKEVHQMTNDWNCHLLNM